MSERDTLLQTLPPDLHDDAERLSESTEDLRDVVAQLHSQGKIDAGQLKDAVVALETQMRIRHVSHTPPTDAQPTILGELGSGAMGEVLIAKDPGLNRIVAVKRIRPEVAQNKAMMRRFYTEAQITGQLDHPAIVPIHGLVHGEDGSLAYAMKLVRGQTLEEWLIDTRDNPGPHNVLRVRLERFLHVCDAMAYAHDRGIVHRDLKPENVMVGAFGEVLVMDWGIAKILAHRDDPISDAEGKPAGPRATRVGSVMGTPRYMSPEQATGQNDILDGKADQYSMGLILYELISLTEAMPADLQLDDVLTWASGGRKLPMKMHAGGSPPSELVAIVDKSTATAPGDRYDSIDAFAEDVRRYLRDEAPLASPDGLGGRVTRWVGKHRRAAMSAIALLATTIVVGGLGLVALGASALAISQMQAAEREDQLSEMMQHAISKANRLDAQLQDVEALTTGIGYAADAGTRGPTPKLSWKVTTDKPPKTTKGGVYGIPISAEWATPAVAAGATPDKAALQRLAALGPVMTQAMVAAASGDARRISSPQRLAKLAAGGAIAWTRVGYASGQYAYAPGTTALQRDQPKVRDATWFAAPRGKRGAAWSTATFDPGGQGQVITCSVPWFDTKGKIAGVAATEVRLSWLSENLIGGRDLTAYLLDNKGEVVAFSGMDASAAPNPTALPHSGHINAIAGAAGWHEADDGTVAIWSSLTSTGWTYVVIAPFDTLR
jgi:tRNA A-37 threonylcarbamoyl transferase component Bud32